MALFDYDNDVDLDVYVCKDSRVDPTLGNNEFSPHADYPVNLFRNDGKCRFTDVAKQAGVTNDAWPRRWRVYPNDLPAGRARLIAERGCLICHSATLITQQHKDDAAWQKTIRTMIGWGAPMDTVEGDSLRDWLVQEYGPKK